MTSGHAAELIAHIAQLTAVSAALQAELQRRATWHEVAKGAFLHRAGTVCNRTFLITRGLVRSYYGKGEKDITDFFAAEGSWITATESFMRNEPDQTWLQALEPTTAYALTNADLLHLFEHFPAMERFGRITISQQFVQQSTRLTALRFSSAADKYAHFCAAYRSILPRLPLGMVASFLGVTQETLSRVRSRM
jgi:CRP-like cAMP-binding protein